MYISCVAKMVTILNMATQEASGMLKVHNSNLQSQIYEIIQKIFRSDLWIQCYGKHRLFKRFFYQNLKDYSAYHTALKKKNFDKK